MSPSFPSASFFISGILTAADLRKLDWDVLLLICGGIRARFRAGEKRFGRRRGTGFVARGASLAGGAFAGWAGVVSFCFHVEHGGGQPVGADRRICRGNGHDPRGTADRLLLLIGDESAGEHAAQRTDAFARLGADAGSHGLWNADLANRPWWNGSPGRAHGR